MALFGPLTPFWAFCDHCPREKSTIPPRCLQVVYAALRLRVCRSNSAASKRAQTGSNAHGAIASLTHRSTSETRCSGFRPGFLATLTLSQIGILLLGTPSYISFAAWIPAREPAFSGCRAICWSFGRLVGDPVRAVERWLARFPCGYFGRRDGIRRGSCPRTLVLISCLSRGAVSRSAGGFRDEPRPHLCCWSMPLWGLGRRFSRRS